MKRTFALAREAQLKTAMRNEARVEDSKFRPDLNPGDEVYIWKKSFKESRLQEEDREAGRDKPSDRQKDNATRQRGIPTKLQYKWRDPNTIVKWDGDMYCIVRRGDKETRVHVNRLTRKYHWTEAMPDTAIWGSETNDRATEESKEHRIKEDDPITTGETVIFPLAMEGDSRIPFGIGIGPDAIDQNDICIQWLGNANS